ncbi:MAG: anthranilate phosphoribosyltransferase [Planctomycetaceae bacterium]|jgi:anthranilate phosphoribosyltransferase|nr:anthranilate phosphoribosyltransferase [Planctomycetaceae bacterium]
MHSAIQPVVAAAIQGQDTAAETVENAFAVLMDGDADPVDIAALLTALAAKGESVGDVIGAARAMIARVTPISSSHQRLLDTCGTGGDRLHTFNISTATALVAASCGIPIAKHGNRSVSSSSGSSDVLSALGVAIDLSPDSVAACLDETGLGFCYAPLFHGAMKHAAPVRRQLGLRTIFNLVGPLTNPAAADCQLLGANTNATARLLAGALKALDRSRAIVVCGNNELDEVALWGTTLALEINGADSDIVEHTWTAADFALPACDVDSLRVSSPEESAAMIRSVLGGQPGPARDIVLANTAAALVARGETSDLVQAARQAATAIDDGRGHQQLARLVACSQRLASS